MNDFPRAGFRRRFASWVYDLLIAIAVYMCAGAVAFLLFNIFIRFGVIDMQGFDHAIDLLNNEQKQHELSKEIKILAKPNAANEIVDEIVRLIA